MAPANKTDASPFMADSARPWRKLADWPGVAAHFTETDGRFSIVVNSLGHIVGFLKARV